MGELVDMEAFRQKKQEKQRAAHPSQSSPPTPSPISHFPRRLPPTNVVETAKGELDARLRSEGHYGILLQMSDPEVHDMGHKLGHIGHPSLTAHGVQNPDYNEVRWKIAQDPVFHRITKEFLEKPKKP